MKNKNSFVNFSSLQSVKNNQLSKFAIFETSFLVPFIILPLTITIVFYIFNYLLGVDDNYFYIYIFSMPFISVPFLLLRTEKSTQKGLELFASIIDKSNHYELYKALLILNPIIIYILYYLTNDLFISVLITFLTSLIQIFINQEMSKKR